MSFKKIRPEVIQALAKADITELSDFGQVVFSSIKSGGNWFIHAPKGTGKTDAAIVASFNKVNSQLEGAPRVIYACSTIKKAIHSSELLSSIASVLDVTVDLVHEKGDMVIQRNNIFNGTEIIVGTTKRIFDLYVQNGINVKLLEYLIFEDFEEQLALGKIMEIKRLTEGVSKTQVICLCNQMSPKVSQFISNSSEDFKVVSTEN